MLAKNSNIIFQSEKPKNHNFKDLTNQTFGRLKVIAYIGKSRHGHAIWKCVCICGNESFVRASNLLRKTTTSCGCHQSERAVEANLRHGETQKGEYSVEFRAYSQAKKRCQNISGKDYPRYGLRGIEFRFESFDEFLNEVGRRPTVHHSLDRKNNSGHYEKGNVHWATDTEQANNRRSNKILIVDGVSKTLAEWSHNSNLKQACISRRVIAGWCHKCAVSKPIHKRCQHSK
jgi:hypothetical protein